MTGQSHYFVRYAPEQIEYAIVRNRNDSARLFDVLEHRLQQSPYLAGADYSIADIMCWCWAHPQAATFVGTETDHRTALDDWYKRIAERPAVVRARSASEAEIPAHYMQARQG